MELAQNLISSVRVECWLGSDNYTVQIQSRAQPRDEM